MHNVPFICRNKEISCVSTCLYYVQIQKKLYKAYEKNPDYTKNLSQLVFFFCVKKCRYSFLAGRKI